VTSHFLLMTLFAALVSAVFATLLRETPRDQLAFGARLLGAFLLAGVVLGWVMYPFPI
jgi:hypothetical protein